jgi:hypothetical protein
MGSTLKYYVFHISFYVFLLLLFSCKKDKEILPSLSFNYFPTEQGSFVIYNVDSTVYVDSISSPFFYHYQLKDVVDTPFIDLEGRTRQVVLRYYRPDTSAAWVLRNVWSQLLTSTAAYRWEDNVPYHKMAFPINGNQQWDWDDMNTLGQLMMIYQNIHTAQTYNSMSFDSTVTCMQRDDDDNYVERNFEEEVYANHAGMVYKESDHLQKILGNISSGTAYTMTVTGYGKE